MAKAPVSSARSALLQVRQDRGLTVLTAMAMAAFVVAVYVIVVIGSGALLGRNSPGLWLSVLATAILAIAFDPVRGGLRKGLVHALHQGKLSPYQVLTTFPASVNGTFPAEELPARMAKVLAEGAGTANAEVWLCVRGHLELAASWPMPIHVDTAGPQNPTLSSHTQPYLTPPPLIMERPDRTPTIVVHGARHSLAVRERGEVLGALTVVLRDGERLTPVEERLFAGLAAQSGLILRVAGLRAELEQRLADSSDAAPTYAWPGGIW